MANNLIIGTAARNAAMDAVAVLLNSGTIKMYTGSQPANPGTAVSSQTLLVTLTFSSTAFGASSNGVATANSITAGTAVAAGTATWARFLKSDGTTAVLDCTIGTSGADINLASVAIDVGEVVSLTSMTLTHPQ